MEHFLALLFLCGNMLLLMKLFMFPSFGSIGDIYNFNTIFMPAILFTCAIFIFAVPALRRNRRAFTRTVSLCLAAGIALICARIYCTHIEPQMCRLKKVTIRTSKVDRPLRILHISDIQAESVGSYEKKIFERIRELNPDLVLNTGDLIQPGSPADAEPLIEKMAALTATVKPPLGFFSVYGDVDQFLAGVPDEKLGGMLMLNNKTVEITSGGRRIFLYGLGCKESKNEEGAFGPVREWLADGGQDAFTILLGHAPDYAVAVQDLPIDLCLAGHTHGGQVRIPFFGPLLTMSHVPRSWARGFRQAGRPRLNVSAGIGSEHKDGVPPIRFNCPSEMTLITLVPED